MTLCFFVSDLHGSIDRYEKLFEEIRKDKPCVVFVGGDILPAFRSIDSRYDDFIYDFLVRNFLKLKEDLGERYPKVILILGNDDPRIQESKIIEVEKSGIWKYIHLKKVSYNDYTIYGYSYVPPTPFLLKDWERYDISKTVNPGCIDPLVGHFTVETPVKEIENSTIQSDLEKLVGEDNLNNSIFLFHSPPYNCYLDKANLDCGMINNTPLDDHVGSRAIKEFIEERQPYITLHGHIHESSLRTGQWQQRFNKTFAFSAAYRFPELAIVKFEIESPIGAERVII